MWSKRRPSISESLRALRARAEEALANASTPLVNAYNTAFALFLRAPTDSEEEARLADLLTNLATLARELYTGKDEDWSFLDGSSLPAKALFGKGASRA